MYEETERESPAVEMRAVARAIFQETLAQCTIPRAFERHVNCRRGVLRIAEDLYNLESYKRTFVVSIGKAAHAMAEALFAEVGGLVEGIAVGTTAPASQVMGFRYFEGGHPVPNAESVRAATAILRALQAQGLGSLVIYMLSGGGSAAVEKPIDEDISLEDVVATYRALVHCGAPIAEINAIRKHLSAVKGGRMARAAAAAQQVSVLVSDVPEGALDALASGPTMPDSSTVEDCYRVAQQYGLLPELPLSVRYLFEKHALEETPKVADEAFRRARWWPILSSTTAQEAAGVSATRQGFVVDVDNRPDDWDYERAADYLLGRLREMREKAERVCLVSVGEVTVKVGPKSGIGGRNAQFALYCADKIAGQNITVLSAGTDGIDGNSPAAGAVVDGSTLARARARGMDIETALRSFDAHPVLEALGDAIVTGPTGTNVRDVRLLMAY